MRAGSSFIKRGEKKKKGEHICAKIGRKNSRCADSLSKRPPFPSGRKVSTEQLRREPVPRPVRPRAPGHAQQIQGRA